MTKVAIEADKVLCEHCNTYVDPAEMADEFACNDCYAWYTCDVCEAQFHWDDMEHDDICTDCAATRARCDDCMEWLDMEGVAGQRCSDCPID